MKTRHGFVSNSSSSSFVIFGLELNSKEIDKLGEHKLIVEEIDEESCESYCDSINNYCDDHDLTFFPFETDTAVIGKELVFTYNEQAKEIEFLSAKDREEVRKELVKLDLIKNKEPTYYVVGLRE